MSADIEDIVQLYLETQNLKDQALQELRKGRKETFLILHQEKGGFWE